MFTFICVYTFFVSIGNVFMKDVFCSFFDKMIRDCSLHSYFITIALFSQSAVICAHSARNQYVHASAGEFPVKWNMAHYAFRLYCHSFVLAKTMGIL